MLSTETLADCLAHAEMHEQLAAGTDDIPARKIHLAMAAAYRRKATEMAAVQSVSPPRVPETKFSATTG
jgi:hypothetical protein